MATILHFTELIRLYALAGIDCMPRREVRGQAVIEPIVEATPVE